MKLKYNFNGQTETVPFSTRKPQGKRLAIHHNDQNHYAKVVPTDDPHASNLPVGINGEIFAAQSMPPPEIYEVNVAPSAVAVMQGQSAVATVTAVANEAVAGLSYSLTNPPTWITISDDLILIQPSDNDLGVANVEVIARDTVSDVSLSAALLAEAKLRPIIESLSILPPTVSAIQGESTTATISAVANEAITGLSFALDGEPSWMNLNGSVILMTPTQNDSGSAAVTVLARDSNSSASASTVFNAEVKSPLIITDLTLNNVRATIGSYNYATIGYEGSEAIQDVTYTVDTELETTLTGDKLQFVAREVKDYPCTITATDATETATFTKVFQIQAKKTISLSTGNGSYTTETVSSSSSTTIKTANCTSTVNVSSTDTVPPLTLSGSGQVPTGATVAWVGYYADPKKPYEKSLTFSITYNPKLQATSSSGVGYTIEVVPNHADYWDTPVSGVFGTRTKNTTTKSKQIIYRG